MTTATQSDPAMETLVEQFIDSMARSFTIGTDAEGYDHHYYRGADAVVVYKPHTRELDSLQALDGGMLSTYEEFVEKRRGWAQKGPQASWCIEEEDKRREGL